MTLSISTHFVFDFHINAIHELNVHVELTMLDYSLQDVNSELGVTNFQELYYNNIVILDTFSKSLVRFAGP